MDPIWNFDWTSDSHEGHVVGSIPLGTRVYSKPELDAVFTTLGGHLSGYYVSIADLYRLSDSNGELIRDLYGIVDSNGEMINDLRVEIDSNGVAVLRQSMEYTDSNGESVLQRAKAYADGRVSSVYRYRGTVPTYSDLPVENNEPGDVWNVEDDSNDAGMNYAWAVDPNDSSDQGHWDPLGPSLSGYATKEYVDSNDVQSDWEESDSGSIAYIRNKPDVIVRSEVKVEDVSGVYMDSDDTQKKITLRDGVSQNVVVDTSRKISVFEGENGFSDWRCNLGINPYVIQNQPLWDDLTESWEWTDNDGVRHPCYVYGESDELELAIDPDAVGMSCFDSEIRPGSPVPRTSWYFFRVRMPTADEMSSLKAGLAKAETAVQPNALGTASYKDVPSSGNASDTQVVLGNDNRLSNARTPTTHASTHMAGGTDALTPDDIGAVATGGGTMTGNLVFQNTSTGINLNGVVATGGAGTVVLNNGVNSVSIPVKSGINTVAMVAQIPVAETSVPEMDGASSTGSSAAYARGDHVHPTDTSRLSCAEAERGFMEWTVDPPLPLGKKIVWSTAAFQYGAWVVDASLVGYDHDAEAMTFSYDGMAYTATRTRLRPTEAMEASWNAKASAADATLNLRGPNHDGFSKWKILRNGFDVTHEVLRQPEWIPEGAIGPAETNVWLVGDCRIDGDEIDQAFLIDSPRTNDIVSLSWTAFLAGSSETVSYTATRSPLTGYVLGGDESGDLNYEKYLAGIDDVPVVVAPSASAADAGKAADAKATWDALDAKLNRAEAVEGYTEWDVIPSGFGYTVVFTPPSEWTLYDQDSFPVATTNGPEDATLLQFESELIHANLAQATRTRIRPTEDMEASWNAKASAENVELHAGYSDTPTFSDWMFSGESAAVEVVGQPTFHVDPNDGGTYWTFNILLNGAESSINVNGGADDTVLQVENEGDDSNISFTATRQRLDVDSYRMGPNNASNPNRDKLLASKESTEVHLPEGPTAGYTEWVCDPSNLEGSPVSVVYNGSLTPPNWELHVEGIGMVESVVSSSSDTLLTFSESSVTATRRPKYVTIGNSSYALVTKEWMDGIESRLSAIEAGQGGS